MIKANFLSSQDRQELELSGQDGSSPYRYGRRANAILLLDDDTIRQWYRYWIEDGFDGLMSFGFDDSDVYLSREPYCVFFKTRKWHEYMCSYNQC